MGMHQQSALSPFPLAVVVDVVNELVRKGALSEVQYAGDLLFMRDTIYGIRKKFRKYKDASKTKGLKDNIGKTNVMVTGIIIKVHMPKSKIDTCGGLWHKSKGCDRMCAGGVCQSAVTPRIRC